MTGNPRFQISSSGRDGSKSPVNWNGQHRKLTASNLERSSSSRENLKSQTLTSKAIFPSASSSLHGENLALSQGLLLDTLSLGDQKHHHHPELKRVTNAAAGIVAEDPSLCSVQSKPLSSIGVEELKRLRSSVTENSHRARDRIIFLNEAIYRLDKYHGPLLPRKRSQTELSSPNLSFSVDRSAEDGYLIKDEHQNRTTSNCAYLGSKEPDKRKFVVSNKRVCTSRMDMEVEGCTNNLMNGIEQRTSRECRSRPTEGHGFRSNVRDQNHAVRLATITKGNSSCAPPSGSVSSSIPLAQWGKQKPPKHQRSKKTNLVPLVSNSYTLVERFSNPESVAKPDSIVRSGQGFLRHSSANNVLQQSRLTSKKISSLAAFCEIEELGVGDKFKDKHKKQVDADEKNVPLYQNAESLVLLPKKTKTVTKEESGRSSTCLRMNAPPNEKLENPATTNHLKKTRSDIDKLACKTGRHPTKKSPLDQKLVTRPSHCVNDRLSDCTAELIDDHEELVAAANAAINISDVACQGTFWKQVEPFFAFLIQDDLDLLNQLVREVEGVDATMVDLGSNQTGKVQDNFFHGDFICSTLPKNPSPIISSKKRSFVNECLDSESLRPSSKLSATEEIERPGKFRCFDKMLPLSQRLLSALIAEEDFGEVKRSFYDGPQADCIQYTNNGSPCGNCSHIKNETENAGKQESEIEQGIKMKNGKHHMLDCCNDNSHFVNEHQDNMAENIYSDDFRQDDIVVHSEDLGFDKGFRGLDKQYRHVVKKNQNDMQSNCQTLRLISGNAASDIQYQDMDLDERILLELQSIGLSPEPLPDLAQKEDEEIKAYICKLEDELQQQVSQNKHHLHRLKKAVLKGLEVEEREHEALCMNKLVELAYNRHMGLRGTNASGGKHGRKKATKQATVDFVKRTLFKCRMFEETGKTCFLDTSLEKRMFSISSKEMAKKLGRDAVKGNTSNMLADNAYALSDINASVNPTIPSEQGACFVDQHTEKLKNQDRKLCNPMQRAASYPEQTVAKDKVQSTFCRKRAPPLEEINGTGILRDATALEATLLVGAKGKHVKIDREGKVQTKVIFTRSGSTGSGRPDLGKAKVERKSKLKPRQKTAKLSAAENGFLHKPAEVLKPKVERETKLKLLQKTAQLSACVNSLLGKPAEAENLMLPVNNCEKTSDKIVKLKDDLPSSQISIAEDDGFHDNSPVPLSHLVPYMEDFDLEFGDQDLSSLLNFEDDGSPDAADDLIGLSVPMDDLVDLHLNIFHC